MLRRDESSWFIRILPPLFLCCQPTLWDFMFFWPLWEILFFLLHKFLMRAPYEISCFLAPKNYLNMRFAVHFSYKISCFLLHIFSNIRVSYIDTYFGERLAWTFRSVARRWCKGMHESEFGRRGGGICCEGASCFLAIMRFPAEISYRLVVMKFLNEIACVWLQNIKICRECGDM